MKNNFSYRDSSGLIDIYTLSPSPAFYYRIQNPVALNASAFGCKIAFYNRKHELIYHREDFYAHELHSAMEIEKIREEVLLNRYPHSSESRSIKIANWSEQGNAVYILEYYKWNDVFIYESVILYLDKKYCYRINERDNDFKTVKELQVVDQPFDEDAIELKLNSLGIKVERPYLHKVKKGIFSKTWFPK